MRAAIRAIEYYLPAAVLGTGDLAREFPEWSVAKIESKTGISERHIAADGECSSDLGIAAAKKLFACGAAQPGDIDFLLFCTQSPDYFLPTTACLVQAALDIPTTAGALDFNLGCSGFVYGLSLAKGLIETGQASAILLITAETYSKFIHPRDRSVRTIFGDGAAATLIRAEARDDEALGPFVFGTDGSGAKNLIVPRGGMRDRAARSEALEDREGNWRGPENLYMNGAELFSFTMTEVPASVNALLRRTDTTFADYDLFVFHQANRYMLNHLRKSMGIPEDRFYTGMEHCGNTVSSTIPVALRNASEEGRLKAGDRVMAVGFGVGYSWCATSIRWT
jgi:3-oxoacyl-[acyl-carrier-protein] synthase-3